MCTKYTNTKHENLNQNIIMENRNIKCILLIVVTINSLCNAAPIDNGPVIFQNCTQNDVLHYEHFDHEPTELLLTECTLENVPNSFFLRFLTVTSVEITRSHITTIQEYALNGLRQLHGLYLRENNLTELHSWSDHNFEQLDTLDLSKNQLHQIDANALKRYPNLLQLNLESNAIYYWPDGIFLNTPNVQQLNIGVNQLTSIDSYMFKDLKDLIELSLHSNRIKSIDAFAFSSNVHLKSLRLDHNELILFDALISYSLPRLHYLNLSSNHLKDVSEKTFQKNLELKILDLSYNELVELKNYAFAGLQTLEILNVSNNKIDVLLPLSFQEFGKLKTLDYSYNRLEYLFDSAIDSLVNLEEFNLANNNIDEIEVNVFEQQKLLHTLDLGHNKLTSDEFLMNLPSLRHLKMNDNRFDRLNLSVLFHLDTADLIGNPWKCSWLIVEMMRSADGFKFGQNYSIETQDLVLTVPGIDCTDDNGMNRSIVMLQATQNRSAVRISQMEDTSSSSIHNRSLGKLFDNEFDYKACIIWTAIGIVIVFGALQLGKICLRKSERKSEEWRRKQQLTLLNIPSPANSGKYRNTQISFTPVPVTPILKR